MSDSPAKHDPARLDKVVNLCKRRGFVFPSGEIYGGTRSAWDYGPLGVELKENIKRQWWRTVVQPRARAEERSRRWPWVLLTLVPILVIVVTGVWLLLLMRG